LVLNSNLAALGGIRAFVHKSHSLYTTPIPAKLFRGVPLGVDPWCWGLQRVNIPT